MISSARKALIGVGVLVTIALWVVEAPTILYFANTGVVPLIDLLLLLAAVISISVGGLKVLLGKSGRSAFALYLAFAAMALLAMHFLFATAFLVGAAVSVIALILPLAAQQGSQADGPTSGGSAA